MKIQIILQINENPEFVDIFFVLFFCQNRSRLAKAKIDAGTENEKKDDSGNETGAGEGEPEEEQDVVHYDKSKSFFDNISCEAVERSKGLVISPWSPETQRPMKQMFLFR